MMKRYLIAILFLLGIPSLSFGAGPVFDTGSFCGQSTSGSMSCALNVTSTLNRMLIVNELGNVTFTGCTYNGTPFSLVATTSVGTSVMQVLSFVNPPSGSGTTTCTASAGGNLWRFVVGDYAGVSQSGQPEATHTQSTSCGNTNYCSSTVTTVTDNDMIVQAITTASGVDFTCTNGNFPGTDCANMVTGSSGNNVGLSDKVPIHPAGAATIQSTIAFNGTSNLVSIITLALAPASAAVSAVTPVIWLRGQTIFQSTIMFK